MTVTTTVMVVEPQRLMMEALAHSLGKVPDFELVAGVCDGAEVMESACRLLPRVIVLSSDAFGKQTLGVVATMSLEVPDTAIALCVARPTKSFVDRALDLGVMSVVAKDTSFSCLVDAIRGAARGRVTLDPRLAQSDGKACTRLSEREREILQLTSTGASVLEIAAELHLVPGTVRNVCSTAMQKLHGRNRFDTALIARQEGWL
jgi:two-component system, NarL family, response regulator DesR